jgi:hypothetical protein
MAAASLTCQATPTPMSWSGCAALVLAGIGGACRTTCAITGDHSMAKSAAAARIDEAVALLLAGRSASAVVSQLSERHGVTRRQAQRYVASGYEVIRGDIEQAKLDRRQQVAVLVHLLQEGCAVALASKNIGALVGAAREIRELCGLAPKVTHL